jgi:hypothetical protein
VEFGDVGAGWQINPDFTFMPGFVIILSDPLADFAGSGSNHGVKIRIVARIPSEYLNPKSSLLEVWRVAFQSMLDDVSQQTRIPLAIFEPGVRQDALQLFADRVAFRFGLRRPTGVRRLSVLKTSSW